MSKCECHGVEQKWINDKRRRSGGYWRCVVKFKEAQRKYLQTPKGKAFRKRSQAKWNHSANAKQIKKEWRENNRDKSRQISLDYWNKVGRFRRRERRIEELDTKIEEMIVEYPFLKEILDGLQV